MLFFNSCKPPAHKTQAAAYICNVAPVCFPCKSRHSTLTKHNAPQRHAMFQVVAVLHSCMPAVVRTPAFTRVQLHTVLHCSRTGYSGPKAMLTGRPASQSLPTPPHPTPSTTHQVDAPLCSLPCQAVLLQAGLLHQVRVLLVLCWCGVHHLLCGCCCGLGCLVGCLGRDELVSWHHLQT